MIEQLRPDDPDRFIFYDDPTEITATMKDRLGRFPPVKMEKRQAEILAKMLFEYSTLLAEKGNRFAKVNAFIEIVKQNEDMDKDLLIACINASGDLIER